MLEQYGGHDHAAGMTMKVENYLVFKNKFEEVVSNSISPDLLKLKVLVEVIYPSRRLMINFTEC